MGLLPRRAHLDPRDRVVTRIIQLTRRLTQHTPLAGNGTLYEQGPQALRLSQVNVEEFAWMKGLIAAMGFRPYRLQCPQADISLVLDTAKPGRTRIV